MDKTKSYEISKHKIWEAYELVKANKGAAGVDEESIQKFEANLKDNLYKIWNRMSSGSYFPPLVKAVEIPKKNGGVRILGVPTVSDRIAQMTAKLYFEPKVEPIFHPDSYGYRPGKSAIDAVRVTRTRCWRYDWVLEFDIKGLFDNIDHELLMKAVRKHTDYPWVILYILRWLMAPTTRSTNGWQGNNPKIRGQDTRIMQSSTAERKKRLNNCWSASENGSTNVNLNFIRRKPGLSIAKTMAV